MQASWPGSFPGEVSARSLLGWELHLSPPHSQPPPSLCFLETGQDWAGGYLEQPLYNVHRDGTSKCLVMSQDFC